MESIVKKRIEAIDVLRGIVMVIMALDHTRDFFHATAWTDDPLNLQTTSGFLFFTRFVTHFCAPIFVFLSGTSIYLQSLRKSPNELFMFLLTRGLWLILLEVTIVTMGETFNFRLGLVILQVIWVIGISMVILAFLQKLPFSIVFSIGLLIVLGHNLLDFPEKVPGFKAGFWWELLHHGMFAVFPIAPGHALAIVYPFLPWLGLMILGYCFGRFYAEPYTSEKRIVLFRNLGIGLLLFFVALRFLNVYGDPHPWSLQRNGCVTFLSFLKVHKYPPSLLYMSLTIGVGILALSFLENARGFFFGIMRTFGRVAFFYYLIHWYILHGLAFLYFHLNGHDEKFAVELSKHVPMRYVVPEDGVGLPVVYLIWICFIIGFYPVCRWYDRYKTSHQEKKWLSYL